MSDDIGPAMTPPCEYGWLVRVPCDVTGQEHRCIRREGHDTFHICECGAAAYPR